MICGSPTSLVAAKAAESMASEGKFPRPRHVVQKACTCRASAPAVVLNFSRIRDARGNRWRQASDALCAWVQQFVGEKLLSSKAHQRELAFGWRKIVADFELQPGDLDASEMCPSAPILQEQGETKRQHPTTPALKEPLQKISLVSPPSPTSAEMSEQGTDRPFTSIFRP
jgi:hypothetical protein